MKKNPVVQLEMTKSKKEKEKLTTETTNKSCERNLTEYSLHGL